MKSVLIATLLVAIAVNASAESVAELNQSKLIAIDKNNDGFLSRDEFDAFSDFAFQEMDDDKNGTLGLDEAKRFLDIKQFQRTDHNGDNLISRSEYDAQMADDFTNADKDGNGQLD